MCEVIGELTAFPYFAHSNQTPDEGTPQNTAVGWLNHLASVTGCSSSAVAAGGKDAKGCMWAASKWTPYELAIPSQVRGWGRGRASMWGGCSKRGAIRSRRAVASQGLG